MSENAIQEEIKDEHLALLRSTARLLDDAEVVRRHHDRLMALVRQQDATSKPWLTEVSRGK